MKKLKACSSPSLAIVAPSCYNNNNNYYYYCKVCSCESYTENLPKNTTIEGEREK